MRILLRCEDGCKLTRTVGRRKLNVRDIDKLEALGRQVCIYVLVIFDLCRRNRAGGGESDGKGNLELILRCALGKRAYLVAVRL